MDLANIALGLPEPEPSVELFLTALLAAQLGQEGSKESGDGA